MGDPGVLHPPLMGSAGVAIEQGRPEDAFASMKECVLIAGDSGQLLRVRMALGGIARVLSLMGDPEPAARLLACTEALGREITGNFAAGFAEKKRTRPSPRFANSSVRRLWPRPGSRALRMTLDEGVELALSVG